MINCENSSDPVFCTPQCVRFDAVNDGQPIRLYHDTSGWQEFYSQVPGPPEQYFNQAWQLWEEAYTCGQLFEIVTDPAQADVVIQYAPEDSNNPCFALGNALCSCDEDDEVCVNQFNHSNTFGPGNPSIINMFFVDCLEQPNAMLSANQWTNTIVHELGHILGMGHVSNVPGVFSRMGITDDGGQIVQLYPFDLDQLQNRYPCNCTVQRLSAIVTPHHGRFTWSSDYCPGCSIQTHLDNLRR